MRKNYPLILLFVFIGFVYLHNLTRDIYGGDVGDLVTAAVLGGVAHPPGYPLFTILGYIFSHVPLEIPPVTKVGLTSVLSAVGLLVVIFRLSRLFTKSQVISTLSVLIAAFSYHFLLFAVIPEVFMLHALLMSLVLFTGLLFYKTKNVLFLKLCLFCFGLGLTNHHTILGLTPFVVGVLISRRRLILELKQKLVTLPLYFILGLLPYLYVPLAALGKPILSWDDAVNFENFWHLVTRGDYGSITAGLFQRPIFELRMYLLKEFGTSVVNSLSIPVVFLIVLGIFKGLKQERFISLLVLLSIFILGPMFILYAGFPIGNTFVMAAVERFYFASEILILFFLPWGLMSTQEFLARFFSQKTFSMVVFYSLFLIPILLLLKNFDRTDLSKTKLGDNFGINIINNLPKDSVLVLEGDTKSFNVWYIHFVLGVRKDVDVVQMGNYAIRNDFFNNEIERVGKSTTSADLKLFFETLAHISEKRRVFSTSQHTTGLKGYSWLPFGLTSELVLDTKIPAKERYKEQLENNWDLIEDLPMRSELLPAERNLTLADIPSYYADASAEAGEEFFSRYQDYNVALEYYSKSISIDPLYSKGWGGSAFAKGSLRDCSGAERDIVKAIELFPIESLYYRFRYYNALECLKDLELAKKLAFEYERIFKQKLINDEKIPE